METVCQILPNENNNNFNILLVTANVGSLFEDPDNLLEQWLIAVLGKVTQVNPKFFALHLQEVGGKTYEKSMEYVHKFVRKLCDKLAKKQFSKARIYMDENFHSVENFTALGSLYFLHVSMTDSKIWDFQNQSWETVNATKIYSGEVGEVTTKEKSKFPKNFFPECKWSRKGYMRTRWNINNTTFDLVNIHLFHDASNFAASVEFPSTYCSYRRRALIYTLQKFHLDERNGCVPLFIFGDFNFRCDTEGVVTELTKNLTIHRVHTVKDDCTKMYYRNAFGENVFTLGIKEFNHKNHQIKFRQTWLKKFDRDLEPLKGLLNEFSIDFAPSYPFEENVEHPVDYMATRCPSWCDRILMNPQAKQLIANLSPNVYNVIGENVCMGDHKPVYLNIRLKANQGIISRRSSCQDHKNFEIYNVHSMKQEKQQGPSVNIRYVIIRSINEAIDNMKFHASENLNQNGYDTIITPEIGYDRTVKIFQETSF